MGTGKHMRYIYKGCFSALAAAFAALALAGCSLQDIADQLSQNPAADSSAQETQPQQDTAVRPSNIYDSEDTAVVVKKDYEAGTIQLQNIRTSRRYTLNYSGTTRVYNRHGDDISMKQLEEGSVVTARFYRENKALSYIKAISDGIYYSKLDNYSMDLEKGTFSTGGNIYNISGHIVVISDGREADLMDVNKVDVLSVWGYDNMIYGINVERGHGYLRLQNETYFVDGWVEVGDRIMRKITKDMLLVVPEGTFDVTVSSKGSSATQRITFARNEEMAWDLGSIEITVVQKGSIIFAITPATATAAVTIDGNAVNIAKPVELDYGLHRMRITAEGYDTISQYIRVAEPTASIDIELQKSEEESVQEESSSADTSLAQNDNTTASPPGTKTQTNTDTDANDGGEESSESKESDGDDNKENDDDDDDDNVISSDSDYKVYIDAPDGVEAYLNGNYIGITPVSFAKTAGNYVITLRKTGYQTRSYTLQIDSEKKDVNYSFTELSELD